jgi:hypothetical protein
MEVNVKTPKAPDPVKTAEAQAQMNKETAVAQAGLNSTNQVTPYGNLTYSESGTWSDGTPRFTATQTLSPNEQKLYDTNSVTEQNIAQIGQDQSARIGALLSSPVDLSNEAVEGRLAELGQKRLDPMFAQREDQLRTSLLNRGIREGSEAFNREMGQFGQGRNDAYNQLFLSGRGQAVQEALASRNQPINEITALMSGSQVQAPNFVGTPQTPVSGVDYAGLVRDNYNAKLQSQNAMMGGLMGLGGSLLGGWARGGFPMPSDRRAKEDIRRIGTADNGLPIYVYRYKGQRTHQIGFMADEVREVRPEAVVSVGGLDHVRYDLAVR